MNVAWVRRAVGQIGALLVEVLRQFNDSASGKIDHRGPDVNPRVSDVTIQIRGLKNDRLAHRNRCYRLLRILSRIVTGLPHRPSVWVATGDEPAFVLGDRVKP